MTAWQDALLGAVGLLAAIVLILALMGMPRPKP